MPSPYPALMWAVIGGMVGNVASHAMLSRALRPGKQIVLLLAAFCVGVAVTVGTTVLVVHGDRTVTELGYVMFNVATYAALAYVYFHYVNISSLGLRPRILREIRDAPTGLSEKDILLRCDSREIVEDRIEKLTESGQLTMIEGRYHVGKPYFLWLFWTFELMKLGLLRHGNRIIEGCERADCNDLSRGNLVDLLMAAVGLVTSVWQCTFFRFLLVGGLNTAVGYGMYAALVLIGIDYRIAITILTVLTILFNFVTYGHLVYGNTRKRLIVRFICVYGLIYVLNQAMLIGLVTHGVGELLAQAAVLPIIVLTSFFLNKVWVFNVEEAGHPRTVSRVGNHE